VNPLKIKFPSKNMREKQIHQLLIQFINYVWEKNEMGRTCGTYGGGKRDAQGVGGET
jgi:hypothetical protein